MKKYFLKFKLLFCMSVIFICLTAVLNTFFAFILKRMVDVSVNKDLNEIIYTLVISIFYIIILVITEYIRKILSNKFIYKNITNFKNDVFDKILNTDFKSYSGENTAEYISILTNDIEIMEGSYFSNNLDIIQTVMQFIIALTALIKLSTYMGVGILGICILPIIIPNLFSKKVSRYKKNVSEELSNFTCKVKDIFNGMEVIKSFNIEHIISKKYKEINEKTEKSKYKFNSISALISVLCGFSSMMTYIVALGIGTFLIIKGKTTVGTFLAAINLADILSMPILDFSDEISTLKSTKLIKEKFENILSKREESVFKHEKVEFNDNIQFKNVSFSYDNTKNHLNNVSLKIEKNKKYVIVGESGSGKSTLVKLLLKYYDDFKGEINIDSINIKDISPAGIYHIMASIHQNVFMFDSTIFDNITLFREYSKEKIKYALKVSKLHEVVEKLEYGIYSKVGENGCNLSGGEKQRIAIARAVIKNTPMLVLDEATSSLDNNTSHDIEKILLDINDLTLVSISHRLSKELLNLYDEIVVINSGEIVEKGTFHELIDKKGYFYSLFVTHEYNKKKNT